MNKIILCIFLSCILANSATAQSKSFQIFKEKFSGGKDVCSFSINGLFARTVLRMAGEHEFNNAIRNIRSVNLITVPKAEFQSEGVTLSGFKKILQEDSFEELVRVKDQEEEVTLYLKSTQNRDDRYIILVEESDEVIVVEFKGYVDPDFLLKNESRSFSNSNLKS